MQTDIEPISHQQMVERIEWPLLDCIQEHHFFFRQSGCDEGDYRTGFARELSHKRGKMHQVWLHDLTYRPASFDQELLFHAPRYQQLFQVLSGAEWKFGSQATFAGALTRGARSGKPRNEEIFALIAVGNSANDQQALRVLRTANNLFVEGGVPKIEYLFLVAAALEVKHHDGRLIFEEDLNRLELAYADHHCITEVFEFNQTVWGPVSLRAGDGRPQLDVQRAKRVCKTLVIRIPSG
jgi:hypothetical protein